MIPFVEPLALAEINLVNGDDATYSILNAWKQLKGNVSPDTECLAPFYETALVLGEPQSGSTPPPPLFIGKNSFATRILGLGWTVETAQSNQQIDDEYTSLIASGYDDCHQSGDPVYEFVSTSVAGHHVRYRRLLLPFRTVAGTRVILCHSTEVETIREKSSVSFDGYQWSHSQQSGHLLVPHRTVHSQTALHFDKQC